MRGGTATTRERGAAGGRGLGRSKTKRPREARSALPPLASRASDSTLQCGFSTWARLVTSAAAERHATRVADATLTKRGYAVASLRTTLSFARRASARSMRAPDSLSGCSAPRRHEPRRARSYRPSARPRRAVEPGRGTPGRRARVQRRGSVIADALYRERLRP
jgi:hypothetical protein